MKARKVVERIQRSGHRHAVYRLPDGEVTACRVGSAMDLKLDGTAELLGVYGKLALPDWIEQDIAWIAEDMRA